MTVVLTLCPGSTLALSCLMVQRICDTSGTYCIWTTQMLAYDQMHPNCIELILCTNHSRFGLAALMQTTGNILDLFKCVGLCTDQLYRSIFNRYNVFLRVQHKYTNVHILSYCSTGM